MIIKIQRQALLWYEEVYEVDSLDKVNDCIDREIEPISYEILEETLDDTGEFEVFDKNYNLIKDDKSR